MFSFNKINNFFLIFFTVFIFRSSLILFTLSDFPWFYEWEGMVFLYKIKANNLTSFFEYELKTQFLFYTKTFYIILFKLFNNVWYPKLFTAFMQIVPSFYISIITYYLFKSVEIKSKIIFFIIIFNFLTIGSLANFYHFSETHFYFQLLIFIALLYMYCEKRNNDLSYAFILILLTSSLNMELAGLLIPFSFIFLNFYEKFFLKENLNFKLILICIFYITIVIFVINFLNLPVLNDGSQVIEKKNMRSIYIFFKGFFHQSALIPGFVMICYLIFILKDNSKQSLKKIKNNKFLIGLIIFLGFNILSIALNRVQIYDRYRDSLQIGCFISVFLINEIYFKKNIYTHILVLLFLILSIFNFSRIIDKSLTQRSTSLKYDNIIHEYLNNQNANKSLKNVTLGELYRHENKIKISIENKIISMPEKF